MTTCGNWVDGWRRPAAAFNIRNTPWGHADHVVKLAEGVHFVSTPSHGGFHLDPERNAIVPPEWKDATFRKLGERGWYEEDCDWAIMARFYPELFTAEELAGRDRTLARMELAS
jgi:hypothetical protein